MCTLLHCSFFIPGVLSCWLLNIVWCSNVLRIVPQTSFSNITNSTFSLEYASLHGEISTVPLDQTIQNTKVLNEKYGHWVTPLINTFIVVSISVSFVTLGTGLKHVLDGIVVSSKKNIDEKIYFEIHSLSKCCWKQKVCGCALSAFSYTGVLYLGGYGVVLFVSLLNPEGFLMIIEIFGSLALNVECGLFVAYMSKNVSENPLYASRYIPVQLSPRTISCLVSFTGMTFLVAVLYDVLTAGVKYIGWGGWLSVLGGGLILCCLLYYAFVLKRRRSWCNSKSSGVVVNEEEEDVASV